MIRDTRTLVVEFKDNPNVLRELAEALVKCDEDGFSLQTASTIERGQRDPVVEGLRLTLAKEVS